MVIKECSRVLSKESRGRDMDTKAEMNCYIFEEESAELCILEI